MAPDREHIARSLRTARENRGITQQDAARHLGLSRSLVAQIELGNRPVSEEELATLAALYRRPLSEFVPGGELKEDDVLNELVRLAPTLGTGYEREQLGEVLDLCRRATDFEAILGRVPLAQPPHYDLGSPRTLADALAQGEHVAAQERERLGLGPEFPVADLAKLLMSQGIRPATMDLPDPVIGAYVRRPSFGSMALIGVRSTRSTRRMELLHQYAHAVFGSGSVTSVSTVFDIDELIERRASAFAVAFLLPSRGIEAAVTRIGKGGPSRQTHTILAHETDKPATAETRSAPGSQTVTCHDVALIAHEFGAPYRSMTYRLQDIGMLAETEAKKLRTPSRIRAARDYARLVTFERAGRREVRVKDELSPELRGYVAHLAIDAFRRRLMDTDALSALATKLSISGLSATKLVELAEGAR